MKIPNENSLDEYVFVLVSSNFDVNYFHKFIGHPWKWDQILLESIEILVIKYEFRCALPRELTHFFNLVLIFWLN